MSKVVSFLKNLKPIEYLFIVPFILLLAFFVYAFAFADNSSEVNGISESKEAKVRIYEFWGSGCPHCIKANEFLESYTKERKDIDWQKYEIYYNQANQQKYEKVAKALGEEAGGVPFIIIGDQTFNGYGSAETTGQEIIDRTEFCLQNSCPDSVASILDLPELEKTEVNISNSVLGVQEENILKVVSTDEFQNLWSNAKNEPNTEIIDLRTPEEFNDRRIPGSSMIDFYSSDFEQKISQLNKDKKYLIYCNSGNRSSITLGLMKRQGFKEVYDLDGGIQAWTTKGYQIQ